MPSPYISTEIPEKNFPKCYFSAKSLPGMGFRRTTPVPSKQSDSEQQPPCFNHRKSYDACCDLECSNGPLGGRAPKPIVGIPLGGRLAKPSIGIPLGGRLAQPSIGIPLRGRFAELSIGLAAALPSDYKGTHERRPFVGGIGLAAALPSGNIRRPDGLTGVAARRGITLQRHAHALASCVSRGTGWPRHCRPTTEAHTSVGRSLDGLGPAAAMPSGKFPKPAGPTGVGARRGLAVRRRLAQARSSCVSQWTGLAAASPFHNRGTHEHRPSVRQADWGSPPNAVHRRLAHCRSSHGG